MIWTQHKMDFFGMFLKKIKKWLVDAFLFTVVYICGPLETFMTIMEQFQNDIQDPENYAIFYLDVFAEILADRKPWQKADWADPIKVFKVKWTHTFLCLDLLDAAITVSLALLLEITQDRHLAWEMVISLNWVALPCFSYCVHWAE